jgi:methylmalonyl-CoA mutase cobalamin-binding domain/chain
LDRRDGLAVVVQVHQHGHVLLRAANAQVHAVDQPYSTCAMSSSPLTSLSRTPAQEDDRPVRRIQGPGRLPPAHKVRFVTAASLFDGHDAAINIMRRILQGMGAEVIHLGHNRSVDEVVTAALQEDAQGIAISSYQGGHVEYFKYMVDLLRQRGGAHIQVFGGGGGVIVPAEIRELQPTACASTAPRTASAWACRA